MKKTFILLLVLIVSVIVNYDSNESGDTKIVFSKNASHTLLDGEENIVISEPVVAVINFNYAFQSSYDRNLLTENSDIDQFLVDVRFEGKKFHEAMNEQLIEDLSLEQLNVEISSYSPFVSITFERETPTEIITILSEISSSEDISIINVINYSEEVPKIDTNFVRLGFDDYSFYSDYNGYDGTDVTIGILEAQEEGGGGIVIEDHPNFVGTDLVIRDEWYYVEEESNHATLVASIAGGNSGIARGAKLLSVELSGSPYSEVDWLLDNEVNVINMSYGSNHDGDYNLPYDAYYDYISRNYFVTFVAAAGNTGAELLSPATAYNVITVGATVDFDSLRTSSSTDETFTTHKPNLVAPGTSIDVNGVYSSPPSGTSFAAPHVTGIVALMMDKRSILKTHPELVNAILTANADADDLKSNYSTYNYGGCTVTGCKGFEDSFGAGEVRVDDSIDNVYKSRYFYIDDNSDYKDDITTITVYLHSGDELTVSLFWMKNIIVSQYVGYLPEPSLDLDLKIYNSSGSYVYGSTSTTYNNELLTYFVPTTGYYTIKVYQYGEFEEGNWYTPSDIAIYGAVAYNIK